MRHFLRPIKQFLQGLPIRPNLLQDHHLIPRNIHTWNNLDIWIFALEFFDIPQIIVAFVLENDVSVFQSYLVPAWTHIIDFLCVFVDQVFPISVPGCVEHEVLEIGGFFEVGLVLFEENFRVSLFVFHILFEVDATHGYAEQD